MRLRCMKRSTLLLFIGLCFASPLRAAEVKAPAGEEWPMRLGTLDSVPARYATEDGSSAAGRLKPLAVELGIDFDVAGGRSSAMTRSIAEWVDAQIIRPDDTIAAPPQAISAFVDSHARQLNAVRDLLLSAPIAWPLNVQRVTHAPLPNLRAHAALSRMLLARALIQKSWSDLHAAWALQRGLTVRPELISQLVALSATRTIVAAARKLPAPAPPWFDEITRLDVRRNMIGAMQYEAWDLDQEVKSEGDEDASLPERLHDIVMKPFDQIFAGDYLATARDAAFALARSRQCAFDGPAFDSRLRSDLRWNPLAHRSIVSLGTIWQRVARFTAEREATAIVLAVKAGAAPRLASQCTDGAWRFTLDPSGAKHIRFSREIPIRRPLAAIPLAYTVK